MRRQLRADGHQLLPVVLALALGLGLLLVADGPKPQVAGGLLSVASGALIGRWRDGRRSV